MRVGREDVEIVHLKKSAEGKWGHPEVQNRKPSWQQGAGANGASGLYLLIRTRGSRAKREVMQKGWREEMDCLHGVRGEEKVAIVRKNHCCQSSPLTKRWVMRKFQSHWNMTLAPFQHTCKWLVGKTSSLLIMRNQKVRIHINVNQRDKEEETGKKILDEEHSWEKCR